MIPNTDDIYLHDTNTRNLFSRAERAFSSGCIRVHKPLELAEWILGDQGWDMEKIQETVDMGSLKPSPLNIQCLCIWNTGPLYWMTMAASVTALTSMNATPPYGARTSSAYNRICKPTNEPQSSPTPQPRFDWMRLRAAQFIALLAAAASKTPANQTAKTAATQTASSTKSSKAASKSKSGSKRSKSSKSSKRSQASTGSSAAAPAKPILMQRP